MADDSISVTIKLDQKDISKELKSIFKASFRDAMKNTMPKGSAVAKASSDSGASKEIAAQTKWEKLLFNEKLKNERYIFAETKRQIKKGAEIDKAREIAVKKSLLSSQEREKLDLKEFAQQTKINTLSKKNEDKNAKNQAKLLGDIVKQTKLSRLTLANVLGNAINKTASGLYGIIKSSISKNAERARARSFAGSVAGLQDIGSRVFAKYNNGGAGSTTYINEEKQLEILKEASKLRAPLAELGKGTKELEKYTNSIARLVSAGYDVSQASEMISSAINGDVTSLASEARVFNPNASSNLDVMAFANNPSIDQRFAEIDRLTNVIPVEKLSSVDSAGMVALESQLTFDKAQDEITNASQSLILAAKPLLNKASNLLESFSRGTLLTDLKNWMSDLFTGLFDNLGKAIIDPLREKLPEFAGGFSNEEMKARAKARDEAITS